MKFSIIIPAYKSKEWIEECLDSIENQTYFNNYNYEILVGVDNCMETLLKLKDISKKYKNLRIIWMNENLGCYVVRNTLIPMTKYDNIIIFDSDDIMIKDMVYELYRVLHKNKNIEVIRYKYQNFNNIFKKENLQKISSYYSQGTIFLKKNVFYELGGFVDWICGGDSEFIKRIDPSKTYSLNKSLLYRRIHKNNLTSSDSVSGETSLIRKLIYYYILHISKPGLKLKKNVSNSYIELDKDVNIDNISETSHLDYSIKIDNNILKLNQLLQEHDLVFNEEEIDFYIENKKNKSNILENFYLISKKDNIKTNKAYKHIIRVPENDLFITNMINNLNINYKENRESISEIKNNLSFLLTLKNILIDADNNKKDFVIIMSDNIIMDKNIHKKISMLYGLSNIGICIFGGRFNKSIFNDIETYNNNFWKIKKLSKDSLINARFIVIGSLLYKYLIDIISNNIKLSFHEIISNTIDSGHNVYINNSLLLCYNNSKKSVPNEKC